MACQISRLGHSLNILATFVGQMSEAWFNINAATQGVMYILWNMYPIMHHLHKAHVHLLTYPDHLAEDRSTIKFGGPNKCLYSTWAQRLAYELLNNTDRDGNGLIYGKDFIIDPSDPDKPRLLRACEKSISLEIYKRLPTDSDTLLTVQEYLDSVGEKQYTAPASSISKLLQEFILQEKVNTQPGPCSGELYGTTFIIDPNDPDKPTELTQVEQDLKQPLPKKTMTWQQFKDLCRDYTTDDQPTYTSENEPGTLEDLQTISQFIPNELLPSLKSIKSSNDCDYISTRLVGEWLKGYDIDGNGLIYGVDFMFPNNEPKKLRCIKEIETDVEWNPPSTIKILTWDEFIDTFPNKNPDDRGDYL